MPVSKSFNPAYLFEQLANNSLTIYDSLSAEKQVFKPLQAGKVGMYVCGMTVYDYCHIGHARVMVAFDMVVRWLEAIGYDVTYVRNITDIDDKIIARASENGESISALTERFISAMHEDADNLGCLRPSLEPKATEHIDEMLRLIDTLAEKEFAYAGKQGDVYYAVEKFDDYGKLSKRNLEDMQAGSRVEVETDKRNPFDFVLWKSAKVGEPAWKSKWGEGRPGWHIECSAMSGKCLGETFDIHGGGHDLQFPHHENEIAQSEAVTGCTYANSWMHVGFINVDGEKMSKSLGNFFTIRDVMEHYHPETIRFFILSSHYRSQVNFSNDALNDAHAGLTRLYQALKKAEEFIGDADMDLDAIAFASTENYVTDFADAMNDDFNTPKAISVLFGLAKALNKAVNEQDAGQAKALSVTLRQLASLLNIAQQNPTEFLQMPVGSLSNLGQTSGDASSETSSLSADAIEALIKERAEAKADKDYARADAIRAELKSQGIELEDGANGTTWRRG